MPQHTHNESEAQEYEHDLHPNMFAGENYGMLGPHPEREGHTLYDVKSAQRRLHGLSDEELKRIPVLPAGSRLEQGATYLNLADTNAEPFKAMGGMSAERNSLYIPKSDVDYVLWNRLVGVTNPERLDEASES